MTAALRLTPDQRALALRWMPALIAGAVAWLAFLLIGHTPIIRASGMALAVVGMSMALRSMGMALAVIGGVALAFSPSFWIQTGGAESLDPLALVGAGAAAAVAAMVLLKLSKRRALALAAGLILLAGLFLTTVGTPRSLRLTTLLMAWTLYLLVDGLLASNPRPDEPYNPRLGAQHTLGLGLLLGIGVVNDPLFTLMIPALGLGLFLSKQRLPVWYWVALLALLVVGLYGMSGSYYSDFWWNYPAEAAMQITRHIPYMIGTVWREPERWIKLMALIIWQFSPAGLLLGVLGLARLSRWHPPVGVVTMVAFGAYAAFGLVYFGEDSPVLLLPLLMIGLLWMTYAVYTFGQWLQKGVAPAESKRRVRWIAAAAFTLLPLFMLLRIVGML